MFRDAFSRGYPTNNALLINFGLSSDAEILLVSTDWAYKSAPNVQETCVQCVRIPTELPFCIPPSVVGYLSRSRLSNSRRGSEHSTEVSTEHWINIKRTVGHNLSSLARDCRFLMFWPRAFSSHSTTRPTHSALEPKHTVTPLFRTHLLRGAGNSFWASAVFYNARNMSYHVRSRWRIKISTRCVSVGKRRIARKTKEKEDGEEEEEILLSGCQSRSVCARERSRRRRRMRSF